jgi:CRP/FNR family cyclic AMP-dependent transcriptional regulator
MKKVLFLFGELNDLDIDWLISNGRKELVPEGTLLIQQGKPTGALYVVLEGLFEVSFTGLKKEEIARLGAGEIVGEMSFIDSRAPVTSVQALAHSVVCSIARERLSTKLKEDSGFAARFYRALSMFLSHRLRHLTLKISEQRGGNRSTQNESADELDTQVLDSVYLAGIRFERVLKSLSAN